MTVSAQEWVELIAGNFDAADCWTQICFKLRDLATECTRSGQLERATVTPDRLLANAAWNLWSEFPSYAPTVIEELKKFWVKPSATGTAVLVLDALSLRELPIIVNGAQERGVEPTRVEALGTQIPTDTNHFAESLGVASRSKLFNNSVPASFIFGGNDVFANVLEAPFAECLDFVCSTPRLFLWHKWPDEPLIHLHASRDDGPELVASQIKIQLTSPDFWNFVNRLRQGRRLVITSDHGYAVSKSFSDEVKDPESVQLLRDAFGAGRYAAESPTSPWPRRNLPPLVSRSNGCLAVIGQRKWIVQGGFPYLCHGGLSLLEAVVPFIELPSK
jgi:hypothetical protein